MCQALSPERLAPRRVRVHQCRHQRFRVWFRRGRCRRGRRRRGRCHACDDLKGHCRAAAGGGLMAAHSWPRADATRPPPCRDCRAPLLVASTGRGLRAHKRERSPLHRDARGRRTIGSSVSWPAGHGASTARAVARRRRRPTLPPRHRRASRCVLVDALLALVVLVVGR
jgi:hypothetical protein